MTQRSIIIRNSKIKKNMKMPKNAQHILALRIFERLHTCIIPIINQKILGTERDWSKDKHSPILWIFANSLYFWEFYFYKFIYPNEEFPIMERSHKIYDHIKCKETDYSSRFSLNFHNINDLIKYSDMLWIYVEKWILHTKKQAPHELYAFYTCVRYSLERIEEIIATYQLLGYSNPFIDRSIFNIPARVNRIPLELIKIEEGEFMQGNPNNGETIVWDNEINSHKKYIRSFWMSKHLITQGQFLQFVDDLGYDQGKYWSTAGKMWLKKTRAANPVYWKLENGIWYYREFDKWTILEINKPIVHINYYEAEAYCKWAGGRLMREDEWEYVATEGGENNHIDLDSHMNLETYTTNNVTNEKIMPVGISILTGNVWCWCKDDFYPYPNFNMEPLYRELSYLDFGHHKILRGGSFVSSSQFVTKFYRFHLLPETRKHFTGFRLVRDKT